MTFPELEPLLAASRATDAFRADVAAYSARRPAERITTAAMNPRVKVLRTIAQLLHAEPALAVDRVRLQAASGCADYMGVMIVTDRSGEVHTFDFEWNCEWKARQLGYVDGFGFPDQIRAAEEFGWQCFERWGRRVAQDSQQVA
jgi:hypothetical protein